MYSSQALRLKRPGARPEPKPDKHANPLDVDGDIDLSSGEAKLFRLFILGCSLFSRDFTRLGLMSANEIYWHVNQKARSSRYGWSKFRMWVKTAVISDVSCTRVLCLR